MNEKRWGAPPKTAALGLGLRQWSRKGIVGGVQHTDQRMLGDSIGESSWDSMVSPRFVRRSLGKDRGFICKSTP